MLFSRLIAYLDHRQRIRPEGARAKDKTCHVFLHLFQTLWSTHAEDDNEDLFLEHPFSFCLPSAGSLPPSFETSDLKARARIQYVVRFLNSFIDYNSCWVHQITATAVTKGKAVHPLVAYQPFIFLPHDPGNTRCSPAPRLDLSYGPPIRKLPPFCAKLADSPSALPETYRSVISQLTIRQTLFSSAQCSVALAVPISLHSDTVPCIVVVSVTPSSSSNQESPIPDVENMHLHVVQRHHCHVMSAHSNIEKTFMPDPGQPLQIWTSDDHPEAKEHAKGNIKREKLYVFSTEIPGPLVSSIACAQVLAHPRSDTFLRIIF